MVHRPPCWGCNAGPHSSATELHPAQSSFPRLLALGLPALSPLWTVVRTSGHEGALRSPTVASGLLFRFLLFPPPPPPPFSFVSFVPSTSGSDASCSACSSPGCLCDRVQWREIPEPLEGPVEWPPRGQEQRVPSNTLRTRWGQVRAARGWAPQLPSTGISAGPSF